MKLRFFIFVMVISMDAVSSLPGSTDLDVSLSERWNRED